jgi:acyl dehydratase
MAREESLITQAWRDLLAYEFPPTVLEVEQGNIRRWAEAVGDPNPLWNDDEYARKSRYGKMVGPLTFLIDRGITPIADRIIATEGPPSFLNGGTEIEYFKPIEVGDRITATQKLADIKEKTGSSGRILILLCEINYKNQRGDLVRRCRQTFIRLQK